MLRRLAVTLLVVALIVVTVLAGGRAAAASTEPPPPDTVPTSENVYLPADGQLGECISALPPPSCGSEARGGWRQTIVLIVVAVALVFIAWRIVRSTRRRVRELERADA